MNLSCNAFHGTEGYQRGARVKSVAIGVGSSGANWDL